MPARSDRTKLVPALLLAAACIGAASTARAAADDEPPTRSSLTGALFYQLLIGEIELREGAAGTAYEVVLDAAR